MNAVILSAALLALPADVPTPVRWALIDVEAIPAPRVSVCPCGPGCACGPACDCPAVVKVPAIKRPVIKGRLWQMGGSTNLDSFIEVGRNVYDVSYPRTTYGTDGRTKWLVDSRQVGRAAFEAAYRDLYVATVEVVLRPHSYGMVDEVHLVQAPQAAASAQPTLTLTSPVVYPTHMAPMPAFRPYQPAPMYFGGFGGGFGDCVGGV